MKIVVIGGTGFIGSSICSAGIRYGCDTVSISRRGVTGFPVQDAGRIRWVKGDVFEPESWKHELEGCNAVIHSVGIIAEKNSNVTFSRMNRDSAIAAGEAAAAAGVPGFVMVSASGAPPFIPKAYIETKREAEEKLAEMDFRLAVLRPGLVYGPGRWWSYLLRMCLAPLYLMPGFTDAPLHVRTVGRAAIQISFDKSISGVLDVPGLKKLVSVREGGTDGKD